jgi:mRNA-degrading endonuclease YafQ of YafQ-DinJ toxin-antitoxin module
VDLVRVEGLEETRVVPGFRDHALKGQWQGYRAIYTVCAGGVVETVYVEEVNKHDY